ncbi:MAG: molecular chaperone TorD family protein [Bacillota bacterium]|nr:molecular chaperone TorD family protein [Bacillota bacterium]
MPLSEKITRSEAVQILLEERVFTYDLLRRIFVEEPSRELIKALHNEDFLHNLPLNEESEELRRGVEDVSNYLKSFDVLSNAEFEKLHWDYTRMFIGPYELPAPPWESAYLDEDRMLFQETTLQVRRTYLKYRFLPRYYMQEADDHLGLELDFMYRLSHMAADSALSRDINTCKQILVDQKNFLEQHLLNWVPLFADNVNESANTAFYIGFAKILKHYLQLDYDVISEILEELDV